MEQIKTNPVESTTNTTGELHHIDGYLRTYTTKDGVKFSSFRCKGKYLPSEISHDAPFEDDADYSIRFVGQSLPMPEDALKFRVYFAPRDAWLDKRDLSKHIIRVRPFQTEKMGKVAKK